MQLGSLHFCFRVHSTKLLLYFLDQHLLFLMFLFVCFTRNFLAAPFNLCSLLSCYLPKEEKSSKFTLVLPVLCGLWVDKMFVSTSYNEKKNIHLFSYTYELKHWFLPLSEFVLLGTAITCKHRHAVVLPIALVCPVLWAKFC